MSARAWHRRRVGRGWFSCPAASFWKALGHFAGHRTAAGEGDGATGVALPGSAAGPSLGSSNPRSRPRVLGGFSSGHPAPAAGPAGAPVPCAARRARSQKTPQTRSLAVASGCHSSGRRKTFPLQPAELKPLPGFMRVSVGTARTEPHQHPHVSPHHWGRSEGEGRARSPRLLKPPAVVDASRCHSQQVLSLTLLVLCARNNWMNPPFGCR